MFAIVVIFILILLIVFAPPFKFQFSINNKQFTIASSEITNSESD